MTEEKKDMATGLDRLQDKKMPEPYTTEDAKSSSGELGLLGGYLHVNGDEDPLLLNFAAMREMTGYEEDYMMNPKTPWNKRLNLILASCLERIGDGKGTYLTEKKKFPRVIDDLPSGDRIQMLLYLRRMSVENGDYFTFKLNCPNCGIQLSRTVNLAELEHTPMPNPMERVYDHTLRTGKRIRAHIMLGKHEERVMEAFRKKQDIETARILARVQEINGEPVTVKAVKQMLSRERNEFRNIFEEKEGGVETDVEVVCDGCNNEFEITIGIDQRDFFFPSETRPS